MKASEAPVGTIVVYGHPANGVTLTKHKDGKWRLTSEGMFGRVFDEEEVGRLGQAIFIPQGEH